MWTRISKSPSWCNAGDGSVLGNREPLGLLGKKMVLIVECVNFCRVNTSTAANFKPSAGCHGRRFGRTCAQVAPVSCWVVRTASCTTPVQGVSGWHLVEVWTSSREQTSKLSLKCKRFIRGHAVRDKGGNSSTGRGGPSD